jgi:hypothetical protein
MNKSKQTLNKQIASAFLALTIFAMPLIAVGQTRITPPKNKYKISDDVRAGREAAAEAERQLPILNDARVTNYVRSVGERLVDAIPPEYQHPEFNYTFKVVNASDINAFALPGGPMFVNRGMIEAARNEGEMAGVMAHEISHVALRHGTAGATQQGSFGTQAKIIGLILGGAIFGGETGAQLGALGAQAVVTKYSREYETQADILGSQIMTRAGYDPRDLANMFRTIESQGGNRAPQWLSSHPNPGNRYNRINQEAALLQVSNNPIKVTREFQDVQARLRGMPRARSSAEIARTGGGQSGGGQNPTASGAYSRTVDYPSTRTRRYSIGNFARLNVPENWREFASGSDAIYAPEGAYGSEGITRGLMVGVVASDRRAGLRNATQNYVNALLQDAGNSYLRQSSDYYNISIDGRSGLQTTLSGRSPITGQTEIVNIYTTQLSDGNLMYIAAVSPQSESSRYSRAFSQIIGSIQIND